MDIRGVEITNQLRSAIRAKLLELGVRYDEELPDYILVMVVNKKSRQQMNEDLNLFLEDSTEPFVNWLHDQVLKKLQKVTIAKKKNNKEITSSVTVKQEDERKKPKVEDEQKSSSDNKSEVLTKLDRDREFEELVGDLTLLNEEGNKGSIEELEISEKSHRKKSSELSINSDSNTSNSEKKDTLTSSTAEPEILDTEKNIVSHNESLSEIISDPSVKGFKRSTNVVDDILSEKSSQNIKRSKFSKESDSEDDNTGKLSINKPRITSVVSVKTRLGIISPSKKHELPTKADNHIRNSLIQNHLNTKKTETTQKNTSSQSKTIDRRVEKNRDNKPQTNLKSDKSNRIGDQREKGRLSNKSSDIKSRLGISVTHKQDKIPSKFSSSTKVSKPKVSNVKSRLGIRTKPQSRALLGIASRLSQIAQGNTSFQEEEDDAESVINTSLRSHIIAIQKPKLQKSKQKVSQVVKKKNILSKEDRMKEESGYVDDKNDDHSKVPSKIIVTPRPLKPLQPFQKRATQSLLLRAVAEANQSVVMQKKIDPCLKEQKPKPPSKIKIIRDPKEGKIISVNLNTKKRLVKNFEKIQIEISNKEKSKSSKSRSSLSSQAVTKEHLDVVKSLFKRSDNKQKFLVTLNGYNNNILREKNSDDEERLEMEVNADDELDLDNNQYESYIENDQIINNEYTRNVHDEYMHNDHDEYMHNDHDEYTHNDHDEYTPEEDVEHLDYTERKAEKNVSNNAENERYEESSSKKRRKLSPIVYTRSRSNSPENKPTVASTVSSVLRIDKRPLISSVITTVADKSSEQCRYWPNCTLGIKCAYYHPEVLCSSFPACKFGEKCAYKHPKCKFGSSCTKLGCIFSHPPVQCKYHPYCMKPGCQFSHPKTSSSSALSSALAPLPPDISTVRAKFTWKKKE